VNVAVNISEDAVVGYVADVVSMILHDCDVNH